MQGMNLRFQTCSSAPTEPHQPHGTVCWTTRPMARNWITVTLLGRRSWLLGICARLFGDSGSSPRCKKEFAEFRPDSLITSPFFGPSGAEDELVGRVALIEDRDYTQSPLLAASRHTKSHGSLRLEM